MIRNVTCLAVSIALCSPCLADDPPDSEVNPQTGFIETAATIWNGADHDVRLTIDRGELPPISGEIATGTTEDIDPRIAISSSGAITVVWTRDESIGQIRVRARTDSDWGVDSLVSEASEDSRNPEILYDGSTTWLVYEVHGSSSKSIAVGVIGDEPDPFGMRTIVAAGAWTGDVAARIHAEAGHVWVTWVQDGGQIGWSEWVEADSWTSAAYESYSGTDTDAAYSVVREGVLGL